MAADLLVSSGFLIVIISVLPPVQGMTPSDTVYVGCYRKNVVDTQPSYYKINGSLTWEEGVAACLHRYTTHMGVQAVNRAKNKGKSKMKFFCGNDLSEHSVKLEESACAPCANVSHADKYCGGFQAMSLYKIRELTPLVAYVAGEKGLSLLECEEKGSFANQNYILELGRKIQKIDILYSEEEVMLINNENKIFRSLFDNRQSKYNPASKLTDGVNPYGFAVDWVHKRVYLCEYTRVQEYDMISESTTLLYNGASNILDLIIDPYSRTLFIVFVGDSISSFSLVNSTMHTFKGDNNEPLKVLKSAVDSHKQLIYAVDYLTGSQHLRLVTLDYADTVLTVLYQGPKLTVCWGLDVFNDYIVWSDIADFKSTIYLCKPSPTCRPDDIRTLLSTSLDVIHDIVIYHPEKQTPPEWYLCESAGCSHNCTRVSLFMTRCSCPEGLTLGADHKACEGNPDIRHKVSERDTATYRHLILSYRESAAFLLRSADQLEQQMLT